MKDLQHYSGQQQGPGNRAVLAAITALSNKVDSVDAKVNAMDGKVDKVDLKFDQLAELFIPRRELNETLGAMKEKTAEHQSRIMAFEQWQMSEMQRRAEERLAITQQTAQAQIATQQQVASNDQKQAMTREEWSRIAVSILGSAVVSLLIFTLGYIITHH